MNEALTRDEKACESKIGGMEKLLADKKKMRIIAAASLILGILALFCIPLFIWSLLYVPMGIAIALTVHAFYGCPFYFISHANLRLSVKILEYKEKNPDADTAVLAKDLGLKENFAEHLIKKCIAKGYIISSED